LRDAVRRAAPTPFLLITAGNVSDERLTALRMAEATPATVSVWDVPGTDHTRALRTHPDEWEARVTSFLTSALGPD
jgi:hypothetical protein